MIKSLKLLTKGHINLNNQNMKKEITLNAFYKNGKIVDLY